MEPPDGLDVPELEQIAKAPLSQSVEIYLAQAYPSGTWPDAIERRLAWRTSEGDQVNLTLPPFEPVVRSASGRPTVVALRLGNHRYPHMKLQIQSWPTDSGFLLSVNTHDQILAPEPGSPDFEAYTALQAENKRIKLAIESAWEEAGLPTFLGYLKNYMEHVQDRPASD